MPDVAREPHAAHGPVASVREATRRVLALRHAQAARPTFGDEADAALLGALARVGPEDIALGAAELREAGSLLGRQVLARRCYEDSFPGAIAILSTTLLASGWGGVSLESWFHRQGVVAHEPAPAAREALRALEPYLAGVLAGYLGEAFNCEAEATPLGGSRYGARLLAGRDVNQGRRIA